MNKMKNRILTLILAIVIVSSVVVGCGAATGSRADTNKTLEIGNSLAEKQPTPNDFDYSLERYNLIRRAYWVNGQVEKARNLPCPLPNPPLSYIVLVSGNAIIGKFVVSGKVSSLNSYLSPDSEFYEYSGGQYSSRNSWLPDVDGSYGENQQGIFFFTVEGNYLEWTGTYLYSDIPFEIADPVITYSIAG
jgi:hypothetical protein